MKIVLHGIRNCDTMKKARAWLEGRGIDYTFHDYKVAGLESAKLESWAQEVGWETLLNRAGTTYRKLPDSEKTGLDAANALRLMREQPSLIKRPVLARGKELLVGFSPGRYAEFFGR